MDGPRSRCRDLGSPQETLDAFLPGPKFASGDTTLLHRDWPLLGKLGSDTDRRLMAEPRRTG